MGPPAWRPEIPGKAVPVSLSRASARMPDIASKGRAMKKRNRWAATFAAALAATLMGIGIAGAMELEVLRTIGDDDEILLYQPGVVLFAPGGDIYVLNGGDHRVLQFDADWNLKGSFSREGQGPGEFETALGFLLRDGTLWIFESGRAELFDLEGNYLSSRVLHSQLKSPIVYGDGFIALTNGADRAAIRLDGDLNPVVPVGPECETKDWMRHYQECGFLDVIAHPDWLCLLINPLDGRLHAVDSDGEVARTLRLMDQEGESRSRQEDENTVSMSFNLIMGRSIVDRNGWLWTLPLPPELDEEEPAPQPVVVRDGDFAVAAEFTLPKDVNGYQLAQDPDGDMVLIDSVGSMIHVLAYPAALARQ